MHELRGRQNPLIVRDLGLCGKAVFHCIASSQRRSDGDEARDKRWPRHDSNELARRRDIASRGSRDRAARIDSALP
jgi:hypothetical protein